MAVHAHRTSNLHPRPNRFGSATTAHNKREEPEIAHQYALPILLNQQQQQQSRPNLFGSVTAHNKRGREEPELAHQLPILLNHQQQQQSRMYGSHGTSTSGRTTAAPAAGVQPAQQNLEIDAIVHRVYGSDGTSTSGRTTAGVQAAQQNLEIDALVQLQTERMLFELELVQKRQCRDLISILGQQVMEKINEKDAELTRARRRTIELEQKVREAASQSQIWFNFAKNNEEVACNLRLAVDQALLEKAALAAPSTEHRDCGPADDAESCCYDDLDRKPAARQQTACRVCGEKEVCVLILPCRHLCLCQDCEPSHDSCPICHTAKNAILPVFLSRH